MYRLFTVSFKPFKRACREYNTYITYAHTFNYYYFPPGSRPAHAHIKGGWPGPNTIHNGRAHSKKKKSQARMPEPFACAIARLRKTTVSYTAQHMLTTRGDCSAFAMAGAEERQRRPVNNIKAR